MTDSTSVAPAAASASVESRSQRSLATTSSISHFDVNGRTRPAARLTSIRTRPSAEPPAVRPEEGARFFPRACGQLLFGARGLCRVGLGLGSRQPRRPGPLRAAHTLYSHSIIMRQGGSPDWAGRAGGAGRAGRAGRRAGQAGGIESTCGPPDSRPASRDRDGRRCAGRSGLLSRPARHAAGQEDGQLRQPRRLPLLLRHRARSARHHLDDVSRTRASGVRSAPRAPVRS